MFDLRAWAILGCFLHSLTSLTLPSSCPLTSESWTPSLFPFTHALYTNLSSTMGFLKRFLSLGSRKGKKRRNQLTSASTPGLNDMPTTRNDKRKEEREQEEAARRLLRSSSAHFTVVSEVDYTALPPMRKPLHNSDVAHSDMSV